MTARELRRRLIVHVVPILNLDGVHRGYTRWDAEGRDPESQWCAIDSPAVQAVKEEVDLLMRDPVPVTVALNLHSTKGVYADSFFFKHLAPSVSPAFEIIQQRYIDALASETALFENRSAESSQLHACRFIESYLWTGWGESVMALTHEGHYHRRLPDQAWITGQDYRNLGRAMARALSGYYEFSLPAVLTWDAWLAEHFDPLERRFASLAGPAADADRDGVANLLEYGMGTDPREARSRPQPPEWQDNESRLSWVRMAAASEVAWQVERSLDLESWQQTQPVSWTITGSDGGQQERVQLGFASSEGAAFYRVLAVLDKDR